MEKSNPLKIETYEDRLRVCLDVVIPIMRKMEFVENLLDLKLNVGPQVCFGTWHNDDFWPENECGTFGCLGGWYQKITGEGYMWLVIASHELGVGNICSAWHQFSNNGTAREELEARAAAIAKALGR